MKQGSAVAIVYDSEILYGVMGSVWEGGAARGMLLALHRRAVNSDSNLLKPQLPSVENDSKTAGWAASPRVLRGEAAAFWACPVLVLSQEGRLQYVGEDSQESGKSLGGQWTYFSRPYLRASLEGMFHEIPFVERSSAHPALPFC